MPAGLGGANYVAWTLETVNGTYLPPSTAGTVFIPILSENLIYNEDRYYSPQIRQQTIVSDVKQSYYHVAGDIEWEVDPAFLPYMLHCSRHSIAKSGAGPYTYTYTPSQAGSSSTAASGNVARTASIAVIRNGEGFGYAGCVLGGYSFTIDEGILKMTANIMGLSEQEPAGLGSPSWAAPNLYGADSSSVYVAAAAVSPSFGAASLDFNGFTFNVNYNAEPQNRIRSDRSASFIKFGETESNYETELDFIDRSEYDNYVATTQRAVRLKSTHTGSQTLAASTDGVEIDINRSAYDSYEVDTPSMGDLVKAAVNGRVIGIAGGSPFAVKVKSAVDIT